MKKAFNKKVFTGKLTGFEADGKMYILMKLHKIYFKKHIRSNSCKLASVKFPVHSFSIFFEKVWG